MAVPLSCQLTEYDCGPVTILNGISFLFDRRELAPDLLKGIWQYSLDGFNDRGVAGKTGTSPHALRFISQWLNAYAAPHNFPIETVTLQPEEIDVTPEGRLLQEVSGGAAAVLRVILGVPHYVLVTGVRDGELEIFDPYHMDLPFNTRGIRMVTDHPAEYNRIIRCSVMDTERKNYYALGKIADRQCMVMRNTRGSKLNPKYSHGRAEGFSNRKAACENI